MMVLTKLLKWMELKHIFLTCIKIQFTPLYFMMMLKSQSHLKILNRVLSLLNVFFIWNRHRRCKYQILNIFAS